MRISIKIIIFLVLFNAWGGLIQTYDLDDHLGINAETGNPEELQNAVESSETVDTGSAIGDTLIGMYKSLTRTVKDMVLAVQPGAEMLVNVVPHGPAEDFVFWMFTATPIICAADTLAYMRGVDI